MCRRKSALHGQIKCVVVTDTCIGLFDNADDDESDDECYKTIPNPCSSDEIEFDRAPIEKETAEIKDIVDTMEKCGETMNLAQMKIPENINEETARYIATLHNVILAQANRIEDLKTVPRKYKFDMESFRGDDQKTRYYTGIPEFSTLEIL